MSYQRARRIRRLTCSSHQAVARHVSQTSHVHKSRVESKQKTRAANRHGRAPQPPPASPLFVMSGTLFNFTLSPFRCLAGFSSVGSRRAREEGASERRRVLQRSWSETSGGNMCRWETRRAAAEEVSSRAGLKLKMRASRRMDGRELLHQSRHTGVKKKKQKKQVWCKSRQQ